MESEAKDKGGRPTKYKARFVKEVFNLALLGLKDVEIASFFEISEATLNNWKNEHPKFLESIRAGRVQADGQVTRALYKSALGYEFDEVTLTKLTDEEVLAVNEKGELTQLNGAYFRKTVTRKVIPPNDRSIQFWLKNRRPDLWRDKAEIEGTLTIHGYKVGFDEADPLTSEGK